MNSLLHRLSDAGGSILPAALDVLVQSSILILVLLAAEFLLRRRLRPAVRHALWLLVPIKLLLPPSLALPTGIAWWLPVAASAPPSDSREWTVRNGPYAVVTPPLATSGPLRASPPPSPFLTWPAAALLLWAAGSGIVLAGLVLRTFQLRRIAAESTAAPEELLPVLNSAREQLGLRSNIALRLVDDGQSPALCGLFRPMVLMPRSLVARLSPGQRRAVLLHELTHARRGDVWFHALQTILMTVWWWHPLLWIANERLRAAREESVDDTVAYELGAEADEYPAALIAVARAALTRPNLSLGLVGILESRGALRSRIERLLTNAPAGSPRLSGAGRVLTLLTALALLPMSRARTSPEIGGASPGAPVLASGTVQPIEGPEPTKDRAWDETARSLRYRIVAKETHLEGLLTRYKDKWPAVIQTRAELTDLRWRLEQHEAAYRRDPDLAEKFEKALQRAKAAAEAMQHHLQSIEDLAARGELPASYDPAADPVMAKLAAESRAARDAYLEIGARRASFSPERHILVESHFLWVAEPAFPALGLPSGILTNHVFDPALLPDVLRAARSHKDIRVLGSPRIQTRRAVPASVVSSDPGYPAPGATRIELAVIADPEPGNGQFRLAVRSDITETVELRQPPGGIRPDASDQSAPATGGAVYAVNAVGYVSRHMSNSVTLPNGGVLVLIDQGSKPPAALGSVLSSSGRHAVVLVKVSLVDPRQTGQAPADPGAAR